MSVTGLKTDDAPPGDLSECSFEAEKHKPRLQLPNWVSRIFKQRWTDIGLRAKMSLLIEVGVVALTTIFLFLGVSSAQQSSRQIQNERMRFARLSANTLDANLRYINSILSVLANRKTLQDPETVDDENIHQALGDTFEQISNTSQSLYYLDQDGTPLAWVMRKSLEIDWKALPIFNNANSVDGGATGERIYLVSDVHPWAVQVPVYDRTGQIAGWLAAGLDFNDADLLPFRTTVDLGRTGMIDLVDSEGQVLISSYPGRIRAGSEPDTLVGKMFVADRPLVETCLGCASADAAESSDEVIAFVPLSMAPWAVVIRQQSSELMAPVNRLLLQTLALGGATILGALALVWLTTSSVIRPVQMLTDAAARLTAGDYSTPLEELTSGWFVGRHKRRDEIGELAESFEIMRRQLERSMKETKALTRDLDERVQERTRDLMEAREQEKKIGSRLVRRNQQLSILNTISTTVNQSLDLKEILEQSLDSVLLLTEVDMGAVFLIDELKGMLDLHAYRGISPEAAELAAELGLLDGSCGGVTNHGQLVVVPDLNRYRGRRARSLQKEKITTLVHIPLKAKGSVLGSMCIGTHCPREFDPEEQELLVALGSQIAVAVENARLYAEVQHKEQLRGDLFEKAINAQEEERRRIARELHDETSQTLTAALFAVEALQHICSANEIQKQLGQMHNLLQHTLDGVHKVIFDLRPSMLDHLGLVPAIRSLAKSRLESNGVRVVLLEDGPARRLSPEMETALYRVVQEAITNIARHAAARNVIITCGFSDAWVKICVEDDGIGFDMNGLMLQPDLPQGLGLLGMQERLELLGGQMEIFTRPGSGTQLFIRVPVPEPVPAGVVHE